MKERRLFWRFWLGGLLLFLLMVVLSMARDTIGITAHQAAGTAANVDAIQRRWQADGALGLVRIGMVIDLVFIGVYSWGAWNGGKWLRAETIVGLSFIGGLIMAAACVFLVADYVETICQFIQVIQFRGNDTLAAIAATAQPIKMAAFLLTFFGLPLALLYRRIMRRPA